VLSQKFFSADPVSVAPRLIGRTLYRETAEGLVAGRLVEVEAYCGADDPASHAYRRMTERNSAMFGPPGRLYVYFTYGMHHCANIVTGKPGQAGAVLLRAVEPTDGLELMALRRGGIEDPGLLAKGPGRLCQSYALTTADNGAELDEGKIWIGRARKLKGDVCISRRIGLRPGMDQPWRFYEQSPWASPTPRRPTESSVVKDGRWSPGHPS